MSRMIQFDFIEDDRKYSYRIGIMVTKKRERKTIAELPKDVQKQYELNPLKLFTKELELLEKDLLVLFSKNYDIEEQTIKEFIKSKDFYVSYFHKTDDFHVSNFNYDTPEINETLPDLINFKSYNKTSCKTLIDTINNLTKGRTDAHYCKILFRNRSLYSDSNEKDLLCDNGQLFLIKKWIDTSRYYYSYQNPYYYKIINQSFSVPCSDEDKDKQGFYSFNIMNIDPDCNGYHNEINLETSHSEMGYFSKVIPFTIPFSNYGDFKSEEFEILKKIEKINDRKDVEETIKFYKQNKGFISKKDFLKNGWDNFKNYEEIQCCPFCGSEHVHIESISIYRQNKQSVVRIKNNETLIGVSNEIHDKLYEKCSTYGATVMISYWCEDDNDYWVHIENFHKGDLLTTNVLLGKKNFSPGYGVDELWRY